MSRKFIDQQPDEVLTFCDGYKPLRDANKLLKKYGLTIRYRGHSDMGDQVFIRLEGTPFTDSELRWILSALTVMVGRAITKGTASKDNVKEVEQLISKIERLYYKQ